MDSNGFIMDDERRSTGILLEGLTSYSNTIFYTSLNFTSLRIQDGGTYQCGLSLNITFPDGPNNSSGIITNSTNYDLRINGRLWGFSSINALVDCMYIFTCLFYIVVPAPVIYFTTTPEPFEVGQMLEATCVVNTVEGLSLSDINIAWYSSEGEVTNSSGRVIVGEVRAVNATWFARTVTVLQLESADSGNYICLTIISGQYVYSEVAQSSRTLLVGGGKLHGTGVVHCIFVIQTLYLGFCGCSSSF